MYMNLTNCSAHKSDMSETQQDKEVLLPGFRFHPTDDELVGYYLRQKILQKPLAVEVITQLDIYKFDPWDLPKMAVAKGEKEWYFYCPRDRKYRNSARPNRVTGAGFWKATGTDRPIYSADGNKCIGLKKSLVFYQGRAARGIKTDWMMHEFRLPTSGDGSAFPKLRPDENTTAQDAWAVCRIFKKSKLGQRSAPPPCQYWSMPQCENVISDTTNCSELTSTQSGSKEMCSSTLDLELESEETSNSEDAPRHEIKQSRMGQLPRGYAANLQSAIQLNREQSQSTASWPVNFRQLGGPQMDPVKPITCNNSRQSPRCNGFSPLDMVHAFFSQESPTVRGALDFVNSMQNSPRVKHLFDNPVNTMSQAEQKQPNFFPGHDNSSSTTTIGSKFSAHQNSGMSGSSNMKSFNRKGLSVQIPPTYCGLQPWEVLSPIFDLHTPTGSQLECM